MTMSVEKTRDLSALLTLQHGQTHRIPPAASNSLRSSHLRITSPSTIHDSRTSHHTSTSHTNHRLTLQTDSLSNTIQTRLLNRAWPNALRNRQAARCNIQSRITDQTATTFPQSALFACRRQRACWRACYAQVCWRHTQTHRRTQTVNVSSTCRVRCCCDHVARGTWPRRPPPTIDNTFKHSDVAL